MPSASKILGDLVSSTGAISVTSGVANTAITGTITTAQIADSAITTPKIADASIVTADIADANVTNAKIVSVANTKITGVLTGSQLANTAVTAGVYGGSSNSALITIDAQGRITAASNVSAGGGLGGTEVFTANGTFTIPAGKTVVKVTVQGGGGTGGRGGSGTNIRAGGGSGGMAVKYLTGLTPGNTLAVTVGAGGTAIAAGAATAGNSGATSSVASGTQSITTVSATGGAGAILSGTDIYTYSRPGAPGTGTNGDYNITGQYGAFPTTLTFGEGSYVQQSFGSSSPFTGLTLASAASVDVEAASVAGVQGQGSSAPVFGGAIAAGGTGIVVFEY